MRIYPSMFLGERQRGQYFAEGPIDLSKSAKRVKQRNEALLLQHDVSSLQEAPNVDEQFGASQYASPIHGLEQYFDGLRNLTSVSAPTLDVGGARRFVHQAAALQRLYDMVVVHEPSS